MHHLKNQEEINHILQLTKKHQYMFRISDENLNISHGVQHFIRVKNNEPRAVEQHNLPQERRAEVDRQIEVLLEYKIIKKSISWYNAQLRILPRIFNNTELQGCDLVVDYDALNREIIVDSATPDAIINVLDRIENTKYFTIINIVSLFYQIPIAYEDTYKTAFSTHNGRYEFTRMTPFLNDTLNTIQNLISDLISKERRISSYADSILICSSSLKEHSLLFDKLTDVLKMHHFTLEPDKCIFLLREVSYGGYLISEEGVKPDPNWMRQIENFPTPQTLWDLKTFVGLLLHYQRFYWNFAKLVRPLTQAINDDRFLWLEDEQNAFKEIKQVHCETILQHPRWNEIFFVTVEADEDVLRGMLSQNVEPFAPIAYTSYAFKLLERTYASYQKELLAIMHSIIVFHRYVSKKKFTLIINYREHPPLTLLDGILSFEKFRQIKEQLEKLQFNVIYQKRYEGEEIY